MNNNTAVADFKTETPVPITIQVSITDENGNNMANLTRQVSGFLTKNKITVNNNGNYTLTGTASVKDAVKVTGARSTQYVASSTLSLELCEKASGNILGNITFNGRGSSDKNEKEATDKAINSLSVNETQLMNMINEAL
jgi:hypothetical protein